MEGCGRKIKLFILIGNKSVFIENINRIYRKINRVNYYKICLDF